MILVSVNTSADSESASNANNDNLADKWADEWTDEPPASPWQVTGFIEAAHGQFLQTNVTNKSVALNELKVRVNIDYSHKLFDASGKLDSYYDHVLAKTIFQITILTANVSHFIRHKHRKS